MSGKAGKENNMKWTEFIPAFLYLGLIVIEFVGMKVHKAKIKEQGILMRRILNWQKGNDIWQKKLEEDLNTVNKLNQSLFDEIDELRDRINKIG